MVEMEEAADPELHSAGQLKIKFDELSKEEIEFNLQLGVLHKVVDHNEHFAIHPFWLSKPETGIIEELNKTVGKWNSRLQAYVVAYEKVRSATPLAAINEDHQWLHLDVSVTLFAYKPEEGQTIRGIIRKIGNKASICSVFNVWSATVFPQDDKEYHSWYIGAELEFEIYSFQNRRRGPILRARSSGQVSASNWTATKEEESWDVNEDEAGKRNITYDEEANWEEDSIPDLTIPDEIIESPSKKKKKKKDKSRKSEDFSNTSDFVAMDISVQPELTPKKKRKKDKFFLMEKEVDEIKYPPVFSEIEDLSPKKKKKKRIKQDMELEFQNVQELISSPIKKKKKHKSGH